MPSLHRSLHCGSLAAVLCACGDASPPSGSSARPGVSATGAALSGPFACGDLDFYDLDALYAGGAVEGRCSDVAVGTWRAVAAHLREHAPCPTAADRIAADPQLACDIAECGNLLLRLGANGSCADFAPALDYGGNTTCEDVFAEYLRIAYCG
jgi:hypothetical protein